MKYVDVINNLIKNVNPQIVDFTKERTKGSAPTQVSSEFLINKEQGDWAEQTFINGINNSSNEYIAVKYGRDDDIIAGEEGFDVFYKNYQHELDTIGKRPDVLIFRKSDYNLDTFNISNYSIEELDKLVPKALCGIEIRSSAFLIDKYESYMEKRNNKLIEKSLSLKQIIIDKYGDLLKEKDEELFKLISILKEENIHVISFRVPSWRSTEELTSLSLLLKELKNNINLINKRTFLSITPKVEDLKVVYTWIKRYNVPHFYIQVFFDKAYGISFEKILSLLGNPKLEGKEYFIESDIKNQNKTTIKIRACNEANILKKVYLPEHYREMKELERGRLLFYVKFKNSFSVINKQGFEMLFNFELK